MPGYTPRFLAAVKRRYEDTDEPMPTIAFDFGISLRTLHRMVEREGWRKRGDRPPKDLTPADLLAEAAEAMSRGESADAWLRQYEEFKRQQGTHEQGPRPQRVR